MSIADQLAGVSTVFIRQRREMVELFGFETRNKYSIETESGLRIGFAAEQERGFAGTVARQILGHWRTFEIRIFDTERRVELIASHPFRFFFDRLEIRTAEGVALGSVERTFSFFSKTFEVRDGRDAVVATVSSPIWRPWTFRFESGGREIGAVRKKWGGLIKEAFLDSDSFAVEFSDPALGPDHRLLLLGAAMFVDVLYFEKKGAGPFSIADLIPG